MASITEPELIRLLESCGQAHHAAFAESDGADPDWALWYAGWLQAHLGDRLGGRVFSRSELTYLLVGADRAHKVAGKGEPWPAFYARALLKG